MVKYEVRLIEGTSLFFESNLSMLQLLKNIHEDFPYVVNIGGENFFISSKSIVFLREINYERMGT